MDITLVMICKINLKKSAEIYTGGSVGFLNLLSLIAGSLILPICCQYNDPDADQLHLARLFKGGIMIDLTIVAFVSHQLNCFTTEIQCMFNEFQLRRFKI